MCPISGAGARRWVSIAPASCSRCCPSRGPNSLAMPPTNGRSAGRTRSRHFRRLGAWSSSGPLVSRSLMSVWGWAAGISRTAAGASASPRSMLEIHCMTVSWNRRCGAGGGRSQPCCPGAHPGRERQYRLDTVSAHSLVSSLKLPRRPRWRAPRSLAVSGAPSARRRWGLCVAPGGQGDVEGRWARNQAARLLPGNPAGGGPVGRES